MRTVGRGIRIRRLSERLSLVGLSMALLGCDAVFGLQETRDVRPGLNGGGGEDCPQVCEKDVWGRTLGGSGEHFVSKVRFDAMGNIAVAGHFTGEIDLGGSISISKGDRDLFVATLDTSGTVTGGATLGTVTDDAETNVDIAFTSDGGVVFGGNLNGVTSSITGCGTNLPVQGLGDTFICKLGHDGKSQWLQRFTDPDPKRFGGVATRANSGDIFATAAFAGSIQCGSNPLVNSVDGYDIVVWKLDSSGKCVWALAFGEDSDQNGQVIAVDNNGNIFVAGTFRQSFNIGGFAHDTGTSNEDIFIAKLSSDGTVEWAHAVGNPNSNNRVMSMTIASDDSVYLVGEKDGNAFLMQIDQAGVTKYEKAFGDDEYQIATSVAVGPTGKVFIMGTFGGSIDFGLGPLVASSETSMFAAAFSPAPDHKLYWSKNIGADLGAADTPSIAVHDPCSILIGGGTTKQLNFGNDCNPLKLGSGSNAFVAKIIPQLLP